METKSEDEQSLVQESGNEQDVQPETSPWRPELYGSSHRGEKWQLVRRNTRFFRSREVLVGKGGDSRCFRSEHAAQKVADTLNKAERAAHAAKQGVSDAT